MSRPKKKIIEYYDFEECCDFINHKQMLIQKTIVPVFNKDKLVHAIEDEQEVMYGVPFDLDDNALHCVDDDPRLYMFLDMILEEFGEKTEDEYGNLVLRDQLFVLNK